MKKIQYSLGLLLCLCILFSCKKSSNPTSASGNSITFLASGQPVTVSDIEVDTEYYNTNSAPSIVVNAIALIPGTTDSLNFQMSMSLNGTDVTGGAKSLIGTFTDSASVYFGSIDWYATYSGYQCGSNDIYGLTSIDISANDGLVVRGTFSGGLSVSPALPNGADSIIVTQGKFQLKL